MVVTLLVAGRRELLDLPDMGEAGAIDALLDDVVATANAGLLVAREVIWSPAAEDDRMSSAELAQLYPHLRKLDARWAGGCSAGTAAAPTRRSWPGARTVARLVGPRG